MRIIEPVVYAAYHQVKVDFVSFHSTPTIMRRYSFQSPHLYPEKKGIRNWGAGINVTFPFPRMGFLTEKYCMCERKNLWVRTAVTFDMMRKKQEQLDITVSCLQV